jgi:hypothetical protein
MIEKHFKVRAERVYVDHATKWETVKEHLECFDGHLHGSCAHGARPIDQEYVFVASDLGLPALLIFEELFVSQLS